MRKPLCDFSRDHEDDDDEKVDEGVVSGLDISEEASAAPTDSEEIKEEAEDDLAEYGLDKYDEEDIGM